MRGKGKQFVPHGARVALAFPGGGGYGPAADRDPEMVKRDLARGYISARSAALDYGLAEADITAVLRAIKTGEIE
jgi:N-methylhydantoinase B